MPGAVNRSLTDRLVDFLVDPSRHLTGAIGFAYACAFLGLGLSLLSGVDGPPAEFPIVGFGLMILAFLVLFYCSLVILNADGAGVQDTARR